MFGDQLTIGQATTVALFSIAVVFVVLLAISYLITLVSKIVNRKPKETAPAATKAAPAAAAAPAVEKKDDSALVAAITAAVAAYLGRDANSFVVKSITPLNTESDWSRLSRTNSLH